MSAVESNTLEKLSAMQELHSDLISASAQGKSISNGSTYDVISETSDSQKLRVFFIGMGKFVKYLVKKWKEDTDDYPHQLIKPLSYHMHYPQNRYLR